jgi:cell division septal protein FtsQ
VRRAFPSRVIVEIEEEEPIALAHSGYWTALFADGRIADGHSWQGKDLPILENVQAMQAKRRVALCDFLGRVKRERPESFARFSQVTPLSGQDIAVILRDGQARLLLDSKAKSLNSLDFLESLLRNHATTWRTGANIDLRVDDHAYVL